MSIVAVVAKLRRPTTKNGTTKLHQCCTGISAGNIIYQQLTNGGSKKVDRVLQKEDVKILWDFKIQTDKHLAHNIPDITVVEKKQVWIIDVAIPGDGRIEEKELEKISKYQDLKIEIERLWEKQATVVPVVIGSLGTIPRDLRKHLRTIGLDITKPATEDSPTGNSTYPTQVPLKFLDPQRGSEQKRTPRITPVQNIWWTETKRT